MDIYTYLANDHANVLQIAEEILDLAEQDVKKRKELFARFREEVLLHAKAEEHTFYAALRTDPQMRRDIDHAKEEHAEVEEMLDELFHSTLSAQKWYERFEDLKDALEHHIDEEEDEIFQKAQDILSPEKAEALKYDMDSEKHYLKQHWKKAA
jgi:hemerythrin superfamily protein